jgi:hypothetical protein
LIAGPYLSPLDSDLSLALDASGNPVVSAWVLDAPDSPNGHLGMLRCNDPDCDGNSGQYSSSAIDDRVYPVISYYEGDNANLKLLRCDTPTSAPPVDPEAMFVVERWKESHPGRPILRKSRR